MMLRCELKERKVFFAFRLKNNNTVSSTTKQTETVEGNITRYLYIFTKVLYISTYIVFSTKYNVFTTKIIKSIFQDFIKNFSFGSSLFTNITLETTLYKYWVITNRKKVEKDKQTRNFHTSSSNARASSPATSRPPFVQISVTNLVWFS
jgi:hypothetical protein